MKSLRVSTFQDWLGMSWTGGLTRKAQRLDTVHNQRRDGGPGLSMPAAGSRYSSLRLRERTQDTFIGK